MGLDVLACTLKKCSDKDAKDEDGKVEISRETQQPRIKPRIEPGTYDCTHVGENRFYSNYIGYSLFRENIAAKLSGIEPEPVLSETEMMMRMMACKGTIAAFDEMALNSMPYTHAMYKRDTDYVVDGGEVVGPHRSAFVGSTI